MSPLVFTLKDGVDILVVAGFIYLLIVLFRRTGSLLILGGMALLGCIYVAASFLGLLLTTLIFRYIFGFLIIIFAVVFQKELRSFFEWIFILGLFKRRGQKSVGGTTAQEIREAMSVFTAKKIGALIVVTGTQPLESLVQGGFELDGTVSQTILQSIFDPSSPGHDGAVIIEGDKITKFGVHLPLTERHDKKSELGTRHRSALGLSQRSDALVVVASEERGTISIARDGELRQISVNELEAVLQEYVGSEEAQTSPWYKNPTKNLHEKALALITAILLWMYVH